MAHIEDRWFKTVVGPDGKKRREKKSLHGKGLRYKVRYIDPNGKETSKSFPDKEKHEAEDFLISVENAKRTHTYIDPSAGKITFREYGEMWLAAQTFDESTRELTERKLRLHIYPQFGTRSLGTFQPMHIRELDRTMQQRRLSEAWRAVVYDTVASIFNSAVDDGLLPKSPCHAKTVKRPRITPRKIVPWTVEQVTMIRRGIPEHHAVTVDLGAGCGLRQGEIFGIALEDFDFDNEWVHVVRQIKIVGNRLVFALPKGRKTREVPLPSSVSDSVRAHLKEFPPVAITLPWETPQGPPVTANLIVSGKTKVAAHRTWFNEISWQVALTAAGIPLKREHGMHSLRHFYASTLLDEGESIKAVAKYLGHADESFTLRTYTHLMPSSKERTKRAIDGVFARITSATDGLVTA